MSKSRKSKNRAKRRPNVSPLSLLRPRLDGLWGNPDWPDRDETAQQADLTAITSDIDPGDFLPVMAKAYAAASAPVRQCLDRVIPDWLLAQDYADDLQDAVERWAFAPEDHPTAMAWYQAVGGDSAAIQEAANTFHAAFLGEGEFGAQGLLAFYWYADRQRTRVRGMSILIDYDPPWEGAAKDVMALPQGNPDDVVADFIELWEDQGVEFETLDAVEAKIHLLNLFVLNRQQGIRLAQDFGPMREHFARHVFTLPDGPQTPPFTLQDYDLLLYDGTSTESIVMQEQVLGHRVRLEDGKEIRVKRLGPDDDLYLLDG